MIKRMCELLTTVVVAGALYSGCLTPAVAQNTTCSDRPTTDSSNACANTRFVQAHANTIVVPISAYGAKCDDFTDDTISIQNAWNAAALANANVWLGGVGVGVCKISSLTMPTPTGTGKASFLTGPGSGSVRLSSTVAGTTCAITANVTYGVNSYVEGVFQGFELEARNHIQTGYGFCAANWTKGTFFDVKFSWFYRGFSGVDTTSIVFLNSTFYTNQIGAYGIMSVNSPPNDWAFISNKFQNNGMSAISLTRPNLANISFNEFQNTGYNTGAGPTSTIDIIGPPASVVVGANIINNYFEANDGTAEIRLNQDSIVDGIGIYNINNNTITRTHSTQAAGVLVLNTGTGIAKTTVNFGGNGLYDNTGVAGGFLWIGASTPATTNYIFNCSISNRADIAAEMPTVCRNNVPNTIPMVDANAQYIGYGTQAQLTALINPATAALSGAVPAWPNDATKFFNGAGAYSVPTASGIAGGAALTKTDDTNVTLTLGGASTTALLNAASITVGWSGTLAASRGGTGISSLGTGVATALGVNIGTAGSFVVNGGVLGTPSSGNGSNLTALNGGNISSGVVGTNFGGAGGILGALRSNGSGLVTQAACADLSNGGAFCSGTSAANLTSTVALANGGTAAALTASNGGIFYSTASAGAILSGTATARQMLQSGTSAAPAWSTTTWPATTTINRLLWSSAANVISDLATANSSILVTDSGGIPSLSTTLPAHTVTTSITVPLHIGGSGTTGTQETFQTTSGNGTTDGFAWKRGNNGATTAMMLDNTGLGIGSVAADALLTVNGNTVGVSAPAATTYLHIIGADAAVARIWVDSFGSAGNLMTGRASGGTAAAPTATPNGTTLFGFGGSGYTTALTTGPSAQIGFLAGSLWAAGNSEAVINFRVTPNASTTIAEAARFNSDGSFSMAPAGTAIAASGNGNIAATRYFSGTTGGLASKSCLFNTANVTTGITLTITGGLVTGTTTC